MSTPFCGLVTKSSLYLLLREYTIVPSVLSGEC